MHQVQPRALRLLDDSLQLLHPLERHRVPEAAQQTSQHRPEAEREHEPVGLGLNAGPDLPACCWHQVGQRDDRAAETNLSESAEAAFDAFEAETFGLNRGPQQ